MAEQISLSPVERVSVTEAVAQRILSLIRDGQLKPGDRLPSQKELVNMLGVSRPTLREAVTGLTMLGYLEPRVGQGYFVREMQSYDILDLSVVAALISDETVSKVYEARAVLETTFAEMAAMNATEEDVARMRACLGRVEKAIPSVEALIEGLDFHQLVADATHNPFFSQIESQILSVMRGRLEHIFFEIPSYEFDVESHLRILDCIEARDRQGACRAAYEHLRKFANELGIDIAWTPSDSSA